ncbi:MAG TPA: ATP phosphoribosyltransferase regulatory subunit, partial [bacterium]|nr:ATP phosphoribosyltransferase regulatory subunit [bacterium]
MELPEGVCDVLPSLAEQQREILQVFTKTLTGNGYWEVKTPSFELYESLRRGFVTEESVYKFTDYRGRILALRPDFTFSILRLGLSQLSTESLPWKLCYAGNVFRIEQPGSGKLHEITQVGAEIIGAHGRAAEAEIIWLAAKSLLQISSNKFQVTLGDGRVTAALLAAAGLDGARKHQAADALKRQDFVELDRCLADSGTGTEVFRCLTEGTKALPIAKMLLNSYQAETACLLEQLESLYQIIAKASFAEQVEIDLGLIKAMPYYSGIVFEFYAQTSAVSIGGGGRYDTLASVLGHRIPAVGFAINVTELAKATIDNQVTKGKYRSYLVATAPTPAEISRGLVFLSQLNHRGQKG